MNRDQFKQSFDSDGLVVLPVIHVLDNDQAERNIAKAANGGCPGVFLINHDFHYDQFLPIIDHCRRQFPDYWLGVNFLAVTAKIAFPILADLQEKNVRVDAYWADDARIDEHSSSQQQPEAEEISQIKMNGSWQGMYFGGTAFKKQREVLPEHYAGSASIASGYMDVVTTSGIATGHSADLSKIRVFREHCKDTPLALASGVTPENVSQYRPYVDAVMVATGINVTEDFYNIDEDKLAQLMYEVRR
ncbi:MAG: adenine phosphoribosyltransferase [Gammaproteobacteria bacterium]|nr:adenine phosphoribosyltransferase [Gammaproteobacteria bacterium]